MFGSDVTDSVGSINHTFPTMLGESFLLQYTAAAFGYGDFQEGPGSAITVYQAQFRFYEDDGVTPVAVAELPEPSTFALLGLSLLGLGC